MRHTYSSAVIFCNVMHDFGFGTIAGTGDSVRAGETGGVRRTTLTNSGLAVNAPRFILTRPSGVKEPVLLTPDVLSTTAARSVVWWAKKPSMKIVTTSSR